MSHAPPNWVFSMFSFIGFLLCCIPFPWHLAAWNTGTCLYMAWTGVTCLALFINSIVWNGNAINWAPVWCDITSRLYVGISVAIPATSLCIARRLYRIAAVRNVMITKAEKRRAIVIDLAIGLGLPILGIILQYIPQGHRFNILEDVGCFPFTYNTVVGLIIVSVPPILIGCISAVYAVMGVMAFNKSRKQYNELLSNTHLTNHRYVRLMCLTGFGSLCTIIIGSYALFRNATAERVYPWKGWADTHADFSRVDEYPALIWRNVPGMEGSIELSRWLNVLCAFTFFAFFGFAEEARRNYGSAAKSLARSIGITYTGSFGSSIFNSSGSKSGMVSTGATLPVFTHNPTTRKGDDLDSISDISVSIRDVGGVLSDTKEKHFSADLTYGQIILSDVGGALADYKSPSSRTPSSGASSTSSLSSPEGPPPALGDTASQPNSTVEISYVHHKTDADERPAPVPEPVPQVVAVPRHSVDVPSGLCRDSHDMV